MSGAAPVWALKMPWPGWGAVGQNWLPDTRAGLVSAFVMLPQAVALASIAGVPPEAGVYTAVFPVAIAALLGRCPQLLSGPNTAVSVMIGTIVSPLAVPGGVEYAKYALALAAATGVFQVLLALAGLGRLLACLPDFVCTGLTLGVGATLVVSQVANLAGLMESRGDAPWFALWYATVSLDRVNPFCMAVGTVSLLAGLMVQRIGRPRLPALVVALAAGSVFGFLLDVLFGAATTRIDHVGQLSVALAPLSMPSIDWGEWYAATQLLRGALAIALVGGLQTIVIAQSLIGQLDVRDVCGRELLAQGVANLAASFFSGFAGSGSFNRTAAHVDAGAHTFAAAVLSSGFLLLIAWSASGVLAHVATPAMAATLMLIGHGLMRSALRAGNARRKTWAAVTVATLVIVFGLVFAVFAGVLGGIGHLAWRGSSPTARQDAKRDH